MTAVKICGLTRRDDAEAAAAAGADFVGFVLWPASPRAASVEQVTEIVKGLPDTVTAVGVFVDPAAEDVNRAADAGIRIAQIHGAVPTGLAIPVVRAMHLAEVGTEEAATDDLVLLDAHDPVRRGGTGLTIDWKRASRVARTRRVILAGGLTPDNVAEAIAVVRPFGVDVASGIEAQPGIKDRARMRAFIVAAKGIK